MSKGKSSKKPRPTRRQVKAARELLEITQTQLAEAAGIALPTLAAFETGKRRPYARTLDAIRDALERRGIIFTNHGKPGVIHDPSKDELPTIPT